MPPTARRSASPTTAVLLLTLVVAAADLVAPAAGAAAPPTLQLTPAQRQTLRIERTGTHSFPIEEHAVGSVSYWEDPTIVQAESTVLAAAAAHEFSSRQLRRVRSLGESNGIAQKDLEQALLNEQSARAALKAAHDALRALGKSDRYIARLIASGSIPEDSGLHRTWAVANVSESGSVSVRAGQPVSLAVLAYPGRTFAGTVVRVSAAVDPNTHRVTVRIRVGDPHGELRPGMLAEFTIRVAAGAPSTAIPASGAVLEPDGSTSVWVTTDGRHFTQRTVTTGARDAGWVQILEGVRQGESIVADGAVFLSNLLQAPPGD